MVNNRKKVWFRSGVSLLSAAAIMMSCLFGLAVRTDALNFFGLGSKFDGEVITEKVAAKEQDELIQKVPAVVSMGDSFSAGEGIEPYYGSFLPESEKINNEDWLSHRSTRSWPGMLQVPDLPGQLSAYKDSSIPQWFFVAVSGAVTDNYLMSNQNKSTNRWTLHWGVQCGHIWATSTLDYHPNSVQTQVNVFHTILSEEKKHGIDYEVEYVTLTMGGNDVGFAEVVTDLITGNDLEKLYQSLDSRVVYFEETVAPKLIGIYYDILSLAGDEAELIVADYPRLFCPESMLPHFPIKPVEARIVNGNIVLFSHMINQVIEEFKSQYPEYKDRIHFVSVLNEFRGHETYAKTLPYMNEIALLGWEDLQQGILNTENRGINVATSKSVHPNYEGAKAYARCVQEKINEIEEKKKDSSIKIYVADEDQKYYKDASAILEDRFGKKTTLTLYVDGNGKPYLGADPIRSGPYRITVTKPGCKGMSIVREIKKEEKVFTFLMPAGIKSPEDTIRALEQAINDMDQEGIRSCFDSSINQMYDGISEISEALTGIPFEGLNDLAGGMEPLLKEFGFQVEYKFELLNVVYSEEGDSCIVDLRITSSGMGVSSTEETQLPMHLIGREWLFSFQGIGELAEFIS